jgi:hypothetical protein
MLFIITETFKADHMLHTYIKLVVNLIMSKPYRKSIEFIKV